MQLRRLTVKNIRSYETGHLDFASGTTLVAGDVGAGKTSLLYAIEMALFGGAEVDATYLVRHGAAHAEVSVSFEDAEHRYEVDRRFRRLRRKGKETFEAEKIGFTVDGEETAYSATELRQRVIELLGFPDNPNPQAHSDLWRWAVYVPQERMRDILAAKPQDRLETVRKALGVERYRTAAENAADLATDLRRSASARRAEAERLRHYDEEFAEWTEEGDRLRLERSQRTGSIARATLEVVDLRATFVAADQRVREAEVDRRELSSAEREAASEVTLLAERARHRGDRLSEIERRRAEANGAARTGAELPSLRRRLAEIDRELTDRRAHREILGARLRALAEARAELSHATQRNAEAGAAVERSRQERNEARRSLETVLEEAPTREPPAPTPESLSDIDSRLERARAREASSAAGLARTAEVLRELEELLTAGVCPRCHQAVRSAEFEPHRAEAAEEARAAGSEQRAAVAERARLEQVRVARERFERAHDRWSDVEKRRAGARGALASAEEGFRRNEAVLSGAAAALSATEARVAGLTAAEDDERHLRAAIAESELRRTATAADAERAGLAVERAYAAEAAVEALTAEIGRIDEEVSAIEARGRARTLRMEELRRGLAGTQERVAERAAGEAAVRRAEETLHAEETALARLDTRLDESVRRVKTAEKGRSERAALVAEADETERKATWAGRTFRDGVLRMEQRLLTHAQAAFERNFARYFASLIDDPGLVARTDLTFTPAVTIDGEWTPAEALSGGERTSLALAFRLALAHVVRSMGSLHLDTLLLDEPTDGFSPEQVIRMGELLDELALPQVIIVSHEAQLSSIADRVVRVDKKDGRSTLVAVDGTAAGT